jgi:hypothetical protein
VLRSGIAVTVAVFAFVPSAANLAGPSQPGPWKQIGKAAASRIGAKVHITRDALDMKALAFVVASRSSRRMHVEWTSYCEEQSDDGYTESYQGKLSGVRRVEYYPKVFDGATLCYVAVNTAAIKGARVAEAVFSY